MSTIQDVSAQQLAWRKIATVTVAKGSLLLGITLLRKNAN